MWRTAHGGASRCRVARGAALLEFVGEGRGGGGGYLVGLRGVVLSGRDQLGGVARVVENGGDVDGGGDVGGGRGGGEDVVSVDGAGSERGCGGGVGHCCGRCGMRGEASAGPLCYVAGPECGGGGGAVRAHRSAEVPWSELRFNPPERSK